jgi:dipeptidyl aminopeptidase/acylaminoacyl peptidase
VFTLAHDETEPRRLTNTNPWLEKVTLAKQEVVSFKARDGLELQGLLIHPLDEQPGQRYPLVLMVHGGPESHFQDGWISRYAEPGQLLAAQGFAVFYPNYRGSTGRGVEFSKKGQSDYAGKEFDDLVDAVDHLVAIGLVDKDKVGVTGGSYGGFASAWCATKHTNRFAASVMFVGISDLVSKFGTTDIPNEMYLVHARKMPWDDWDFFTERSPISYAEQARTPILIMHGKDDPRVHPSQSMELYRYLKVLGKVPVRLVLYQGEGHGNRKAAARQDYAMRLLQWMQHYLQGPGGDPPAPDLNYDALKPKDKEGQGDEKKEGEAKQGETKEGANS